MPSFIDANNLQPYVQRHFPGGLKPIDYRNLAGRTVKGFDAEILPAICDVYLDARKDGALTAHQNHLADMAEVLVRAFARTALVALIDEATGYQEIRDRRALQAILDKYLLKEHAKWSKRFPDEFYKLIFEMRGWRWKGMSVNRPSVVGKYTNDIIWSRLAPKLLKELEQLNPKDEAGKRRVKHHQFLTENIGHPRLQEHLHATMALMRASGKNWGNFMRSLQRAFPKVNTNLELPFEDGEGAS